MNPAYYFQDWSSLLLKIKVWEEKRQDLCVFLKSYKSLLVAPFYLYVCSLDKPQFGATQCNTVIIVVTSSIMLPRHHITMATQGMKRDKHRHTRKNKKENFERAHGRAKIQNYESFLCTSYSGGEMEQYHNFSTFELSTNILQLPRNVILTNKFML